MTLILPPSSRRSLLAGAGALAGAALLGGRSRAKSRGRFRRQSSPAAPS